jgi:hypothetical protein
LKFDCYLHLDERRWGCCCLLHDFLIESTTKTGQSMDSLHARHIPAYSAIFPFSLTAMSDCTVARVVPANRLCHGLQRRASNVQTLPHVLETNSTALVSPSRVLGSLFLD